MGLPISLGWVGRAPKPPTPWSRLSPWAQFSTARAVSQARARWIRSRYLGSWPTPALRRCATGSGVSQNPEADTSPSRSVPRIAFLSPVSASEIGRTRRWGDSSNRGTKWAVGRRPLGPLARSRAPTYRRRPGSTPHPSVGSTCPRYRFSTRHGSSGIFSTLSLLSPPPGHCGRSSSSTSAACVAWTQHHSMKFGR
jgi:hypothetical protein